MTQPIYQCVPNFSEGRRPKVIAAIAESISAVKGARLADYSADIDHNRSVFSILGDDDAIFSAIMAAARIAVGEIDLRTHNGIHPRVGAIDVVPVVPIRNATRPGAVALATRIGAALAERYDLPIYFYEWNAASGKRSSLPELRRGGFETFAASPLATLMEPDIGPHQVHPSAGLTVIGARPPLVAYNIDLATDDVTVALAIANSIRRNRGFLPELLGIRTLGLFLEHRNVAQVSMNLTKPAETPLPAIFDYVSNSALALGVEPLESEVIGVIPEASLGGEPPSRIAWNAYKSTQILETWLTE